MVVRRHPAFPTRRLDFSFAELVAQIRMISIAAYAIGVILAALALTKVLREL